MTHEEVFEILDNDLGIGIVEDYFDSVDDDMRDLQEFKDKIDLDDYNWGMM